MQNIIEINKTYLAKLITETKGKIFFAVYRKNDGTLRKITARLGVRYNKVTSRKIDHSWKLRTGYISAFDMKLKEYRTINLNTLYGLKFQGKVYIVN